MTALPYPSAPEAPGSGTDLTKSRSSCVHEERAHYVSTALLRRVAHDIASPAGVTMTVLDELAVGARPELVAMARRGLRRLMRLSDQLALVADLESGSFTPDCAPEDFRTVVQTAFDNAVGIDGRRDIATELVLPESRVLVDVDRRVLISVLREAVGNALRLATSKVAVDVTVSDGRVTVRVHDDGMGFKPEIKEAIGERFTTRMGARGLGLSMSMAKEVLAAHGGELAIETTKLPPGRRGGQGAAVAITLPTMPASTVPSSTSAAR